MPFLDKQVTKLEDGKIRTTVYRKATNIMRILHFRSNHPVAHKCSCVRTLFQRVQTHCSDDSGKKEETKYLHALFEANGYPKPFIRKCLRKPNHERSKEEDPKFWLAIPYVKDLAEAILESAQRHRKLSDANLLEKFKQIIPPKPPTSDGNLVHNLPSHRLTEPQLTVLSYDAKFNTSDA
ncbi:unnamed protein product [Schistocephalus solidus]|uniref:Helix-turn-helix domain-containing protein n=1 Tax=Schistocephalus solidus TaxID=70667 RepID=A0A3P7C9N4_SCHSO|nr:unnamed protein product [Schistocephalus solidus]